MGKPGGGTLVGGVLTARILWDLHQTSLILGISQESPTELYTVDPATSIAAVTSTFTGTTPPPLPKSSATLCLGFATPSPPAAITEALILAMQFTLFVCGSGLDLAVLTIVVARPCHL